MMCRSTKSSVYLPWSLSSSSSSLLLFVSSSENRYSTHCKITAITGHVWSSMVSSHPVSLPISRQETSICPAIIMYTNAKIKTKTVSPWRGQWGYKFLIYNLPLNFLLQEYETRMDPIRHASNISTAIVTYILPGTGS